MSDDIERFIKGMISEEECQIELQRNELAQHFGCAPSQINYVLSTRFTRDHGYLIESRRGGGGYIRIVQLRINDRGSLLADLTDRIGCSISREQALAILRGLYEGEIIDRKMAQVMRAALEAPTMTPAGGKDYVRASLLKHMLEALLIWEAKEEST